MTIWELQWPKFSENVKKVKKIKTCTNSRESKFSYPLFWCSLEGWKTKQNKQKKNSLKSNPKHEEKCMWLLMLGNGIRLWSRKHLSPSLRAPSQLQHTWILQLLLTNDFYVSCSYFMHSWWFSSVSFTIHYLVRNVYHWSLIKRMYIHFSCRDQHITESAWALVRYRDW